MARLAMRLAFNGSNTLRSIQDPKQLVAKGFLSLITIKAIQHLNLGASVKTRISYYFGYHLIPHTFFNHWMLAALAL
jgi:hypothetical protein